MKKDKKPENVIFYSNYKQMIYNATPQQVKAIMVAFCEYAFDEKEPVVSPEIALAWQLIKGNIDRDRELYIARCEQNRENALKNKGDKNKQDNEQKTNGTEKKPKRQRELYTDVSSKMYHIGVTKLCADYPKQNEKNLPTQAEIEELYRKLNCDFDKLKELISYCNYYNWGDKIDVLLKEYEMFLKDRPVIYVD